MSEINEDLLNHTAAQLLAMAVKNIFPNAKLGSGPATTDGGFYYDFDFATPIKTEDLYKIEAEMDRIIKLDFSVVRVEKTRAEVRRILDAAKEVYKIELLNEIPRGEKIILYKIDKFTDLCTGQHIDTLGKIKAFRLTKITGAYWRGDSKNKMLTRIYGVAFTQKSRLDEYLAQQEEIKKRDHNKIGRELEIFTTVDCIGQGLPLIMPNGAKIIQILQRFVEDEEEKRGFRRTITPDFAKSDLYKISGHWQLYKDCMFVIGNEVLDEEIYAMRPMTCPFQYMIYKNSIKSYRDLPVRYAETARQFRNENSGEMHGLIRVREYTLSDGHTICRPDQIEQVFNECFELSNFLLKAIGLDDSITYRLSKWDPNNKEKYIGGEKVWEQSQGILRKILKAQSRKFYETEGDAAFYGPKIDIQIRNVHGKEDTLVTMQLDMALAERFDMSFIDENGASVRPYIVHRSSIGAYERVLAFLIEKYVGAFPVWLSPVQVVVMGISNRQDGYVEQIFTQIRGSNIRAEKDLRNEKVGYKIREYTLKKVPFMLVAGDKEQAAGTVSVRTREGVDLGAMTVDAFLDTVNKLVKDFK
jgi:threonyl-tRNA synthetase